MRSPKADLADADANRIKGEAGNDIELEIYGKEINARDEHYTATAELPEGYALADGSKTESKDYYITKATFQVTWVVGTYDKDNEEFTNILTADGNGKYAWDYGDDITVKAYREVTNDEGEVTKIYLEVIGFETDAGTHTLNLMQSEGNYQIEAGYESLTYTINTKLVYVVWDEEDGYDKENDTYSWLYDGKSHAPTAYLAEMVDGELQPITVNGEKIKVNVNGEATEIGKNYKAVAVDTFVNYHFDETKPEAYTKEFSILANELSDFEWVASKDAQVSEDGKTFTYEYGKTGVPEPTSSVKDLQFTVTITGDDGEVLAITEVGTYTVTATSRDSNYQIPDEWKTITVIVTPQTIDIKWENTELTYNGGKQMPTAYYLAAGNRIDLKVTTNVEAIAVGADYVATAEFKDGTTNSNYKLPDDPTTTFKIVEKEITVVWPENWEHPEYDGTEKFPVPSIVIKDMTEDERDNVKVVYEIKAKDGDEVLAGTDHEKYKGVINAGNYVMTVKLDGDAAGNYKLGNAEFPFTIKKKALTVTATIDGDSTEIEYGSPIPTYDATFKGDIEGDAELIKEIKGKIDEWLSCSYINTSIPGEYTIKLDELWLSKHLPNYDVTAENGTLTVKAKANTVIWVGENNEDLKFVYDGEATLPTAYYVDEQGKTHKLTVALAELVDGEYVVKDGEAINVGTYLAVIVDEEGNVIDAGNDTYEFTNYFTEFEIVQRKITVNVKDLTYTYGDLTQKGIEEDGLLGYELAWTYGGTEPVQGDVLGIEIKFTYDYDKGGFLVVKEYTITVDWDHDFDKNYDISVEYENGQKLAVNKATITVNYDTDAYGNVYDAYGIVSANGYISDFITETKKFLTLAGYQDVEISVGFKLPDDTQYWPASKIEAITEQGEVYYDFKIVVDNHEELTGKLHVDVKASENFLFITIDADKTFKSDYGFEIPEDFAQKLFADGYAKFDKINPVDEATFLSWVTAKVVDEEGNEVTGKLPVGNYKVYFGLNEDADSNLSIFKATSIYVSVEISKYVIEVDWGDEANLNYEYDGEKHMPTVTLKNITDENGNPVTLQVGENVITVNGEQVKVIVTVDGDFITEGGHSILVTVDGENYEVKEDNALRSVSIIEPGKEIPVPTPTEPEQPVQTGLADWQLWVILAAAVLLAAILIALVIILVKRRQVGDDDGFYDPVDESDLQ
ncbi:MAG: hypothetical protein K2K38_00355 [Clostridia bacterium]|nr:hypothetical protein [Clostridia bacterium]